MNTLIIMCIGVFLGSRIGNEKVHLYNNKIQEISIIVLIFCMGISVGSNKHLMDELFTMGLKGLLFAIVPIILSVVIVYVLTKLFMKETKDD